MSMKGFDHGNRGVGVRDHQLILPSVVCSTRVSSRIAREMSAVTFAHQHGCGFIGNDVGRITDYFAALANHPNVSSTLIVGLGCETLQGNELADKLLSKNASTNYLVTQESGGVEGTVNLGISAAEELRNKYASPEVALARLHLGIDISRESAQIEELVVALTEVGVDIAVAAVHKNSGLNFSDLMEAGVHVILSFPDENQPASGFPLIPTINVASNSPLHLALANDFDLTSDATIAEIIEKIYEVVNGGLTKVEAIGAGEIIAAREVRSV
jgi:altronate dehydratase large subunit